MAAGRGRRYGKIIPKWQQPIANKINMIRRWLFQAARSRFAGFFIGNAFAYLTPIMPVQKQYENKQVVAFRHPVPFWQPHTLIVPKKKIASFLDLSLEQAPHQEMAVAIFQAAQNVAQQMGLREYTVLVNGGRYQDVPQLHFHLAAGTAHQRGKEQFVPPAAWEDAARHQTAIVYPHPHPTHQFHQIICSETAVSGIKSSKLTAASPSTLLDMLQLAQQIVVQQQLAGYTLLTNITESSVNGRFYFHLVSNT